MPAMTRHVKDAKAWHDIVAGFRTCYIRTIREFSDCSNDRISIAPRLSCAEVFSGPF